MKTVTVQILKIAALAPLLSLAACVETTAPMCDATNKVDVPNFARTYTMSILLDPTKDVTDATLKIDRTATGEYSVTGGKTPETVSTCQVGRWTIAESKTDFGTYQQSMLSLDGSGVTSMNQLVLNGSALKKAGIAFDIVNRPNQNKLRALVADQSVQSVDQSQNPSMVIHNDSPAAREVLSQISKPMALGFSIY